MNWREMWKTLDRESIYPNDAITAFAMHENVTLDLLDEGDDYANKRVCLNTYNIIGNYVNGWLCETATEGQLADDVIDLLFSGLNEGAFGIDDVESELSIVRDYINDRI